MINSHVYYNNDMHMQIFIVRVQENNNISAIRLSPKLRATSLQVLTGGGQGRLDGFNNRLRIYFHRSVVIR